MGVLDFSAPPLIALANFASRCFRSLTVDAHFPSMDAAEMSQFGNNVI